MTSNPLTLSPTLSSSNLSELSDFELIDQDRDAWSSTDAEEQSDVDEQASILSRNSSGILTQHSDHSAEAWSSMHLVDALRSNEVLNERNKRVAEELERDASSVDSFASVTDDSEQRDSADRTLTDIDVSHPELDPAKSAEGNTPAKADSLSALPPEPTPPGIRLLFPDPIEGSAISYSREASPHYETADQPEMEEDTDAQSALFTSISSLSSLSRNPSAISFSTPVEVNMEGHPDHVEPQPESDPTPVAPQEEELEVPHAFHFMDDGIPPIPFGPTRRPATEIARYIPERAETSKDRGLQKVHSRESRRFDAYTSKRNLLVSVLSVIVCSAACILYGWKATVSKFDLGFVSLNRSALTSTSIFSTLRAPTSNQDASKPNYTNAPLPSTSTSSVVLTIDPTPVLPTLDAPEPRLLISAPHTVARTNPTTEIGRLLPNSLSKYIPATSRSHLHTSVPSPFSFMGPLKHKLGEAHSRISERHQRAKANAKKLGALGKKVWNEKCIDSVGEAFGRLRVGLAGAMGEG